LFARYKQGSRAAASELVRRNQRFIVARVAKYRRPSLDPDDLIQEANRGLLIALERFEPARGLRFMTFARWWIDALIMRYIVAVWSMIRLPSTMKMRGLFWQCQHAGSRGESIDEIAAVLKAPRADVEEMAAMLLGDVQLDALVQPNGTHDDERNRSLREFILHTESEAFDEMADGQERASIQAALDSMDPRLAKVLRLRFFEELTLQTIGDRIGVTRERVRQLEATALGQLRKALAGVRP